MILGCYYVTALDENGIGKGKTFVDIYDVELAYNAGALDIKSPIKVRVNDEIVETNY
jgi:hypothetical protein